MRASFPQSVQLYIANSWALLRLADNTCMPSGRMPPAIGLVLETPLEPPVSASNSNCVSVGRSSGKATYFLESWSERCAIAGRPNGRSGTCCKIPVRLNPPIGRRRHRLARPGGETCLLLTFSMQDTAACSHLLREMFSSSSTTSIRLASDSLIWLILSAT